MTEQDWTEQYYMSEEYRVSYQHIHMDPLRKPRNRKTRIWNVINNRSGDLLGTIKWYCAWRQYCFQPDANTVWSVECLHDINTFIKEEITPVGKGS